MALVGNLGTWEKVIIEKTWSQKSSGTVPVKAFMNLTLISYKGTVLLSLYDTPNQKEKTTLQLILKGMCKEMNNILRTSKILSVMYSLHDRRRFLNSCSFMVEKRFLHANVKILTNSNSYEYILIILYTVIGPFLSPESPPRWMRLSE